MILSTNEIIEDTRSAQEEFNNEISRNTTGTPPKADDGASM